MKSKKIFILLAALGLSLAACNPAVPSSSGSNTPSGGDSTTPAQSTGDQSSGDSGQQTVAVTGITLNKTELSLEEGKDETLTATVAPDNASNTKVTWTTSNDQVATVSNRGKVTAVKVGTATITVTSESNPQVTATCAVTVTEEGGKYGSLNKPKTVAQILAIAADECKEDGDQTTDVVYVKGLVTKNPNYVADKGFSQNIYLKDALTDAKDLLVYSANHDALKIPYQNDTVVLHGYLKNYKGTIEITNVKVSGSDVYPELDSVTRGTSSISYAISNGTVNADAPKSGKNNSEFSFTVTPNQGYVVNSVTVNGAALTAETDGSYKAIIKGNTSVFINIFEQGVEINSAVMKYSGATGNMTGGNDAALVNLDATLFDVSSDKPTGLYAGLNGAGNIRLYNGYNNASDRTLGTKLTISSRRALVKKIIVTLAASTVSGLADLEVKAGDQLVTGTADGIYDFSAGTFTLKNVSNAEKSSQIHIASVAIFYTLREEVKATGISVAPTSLEIEAGKDAQLTATLEPSNSTDVVGWTTSNDKVATVDATGKVLGVAEGSAVITAKVSDSIKQDIPVTVTKAEVINYGTAAAPLTVAEAKAVLDKTGSNMSKQPLFVKGVVSTNGEPNKYGQQEVWLQSDDGTVAKAFESWSTVLDASITGDFSAADSMKGYEAVITGYGKIFTKDGVDTYELTNNSVNDVRINPTILSLKEQSGQGGQGGEGGETPVTDSLATYNFTSANAENTRSVTDLAIVGSLFTKVKGEELFKEVTEVTNVYEAASGGSDPNKFSISNILKLGKSQAAGSIKFSLNKEVKKIVVKGDAWTQTASITINGVTVTEAFKDNVISKAVIVDNKLTNAGTLSFEFSATKDITISVGNSNSKANFGVVFAEMEFFA